jgi:energy-coupling factor transport system ATP-binding protein
VIKNLDFSYQDGQKIFSNFTGRLPYGKVTILTGESGKGKTTLARILGGLEKQNCGSVFFENGANRDETSVVLQNTDHQLYMPTLKDEVELTDTIHGKSKPENDTTLKILETFGLRKLANRHPQSLSGGEKQRLVVAKTITQKTSLLILDEPTSGLDGKNLKIMANQIIKIAHMGPAVLVITHDWELAQLCGHYHIEL